MFPHLRLISFITLLLYSLCAWGTSIFHSYITDLSPPYICKLKLKSASGVSIEAKHSYQFSGICSIKLPVGTSWIYQNVWVDLQAYWNGDTNEGLEIATLYNNLGTVVSQIKCDDDPWLTKSQCALVGYQNNTSFTNLGGVYNERNGQYPPFEIITGQYPPLARNQAILKQAIALSLITAVQQSKAAHAAFAQTFGKPKVTTARSITTRPAVITTAITRGKLRTKVFKCPKIDNIRVDYCLRPNRACGKPAADCFCQRMGFRQAVACKIDSTSGYPTFIIGTQTICNQPHCKGFKEIICGD